MNTVFDVDPDKCVGCGVCVQDCVAGIIKLRNGIAAVEPDAASDCIGCQHCLAICPTAAVRIHGLDPAASVPIADFAPDAANLDLLVRSRRSVRQFAPDPVPEELLARILETVSYAPTGVNSRQRRFTAIRDGGVMAEYRQRCCQAVSAAHGSAPALLVDLAEQWLGGGADAIFRNAPHLLVASVEKTAPCAEVDGVIALSYFDLVAQANGVGTVWAGFVSAMIQSIPQCGEWLGIPDDHRVGYAILFGMPGVKYARTAQYGAEDVRMVDRL